MLVVVVIAGNRPAFSQTQDNVPIAKPTTNRPGRYILFPVIVKSPEYKWGGGVAGSYFFRITHDSLARTSNIKAVSFLTVRRQVVFAAEGNIFFPSERYILHTIASASHFPDKFWGLGNTTPESNLENYAISQFDLFPQLLRKVYSNFFAGIGYEFQNVFEFDYDRSGQSLFDQENIVGREGGHISGVSFILTWDTRNNAFSPSRGFYAQYLLGVYNESLGSQFNFNVQNLDIRKFFPLPRNRVFAMQFNMVITGGNVPIRNMANIGSNSFMRGYYEGRYTDRNLIALQGEYRTPIWRRWGAVLFAGTGKVGEQVSELVDFSHLKISYGIGLRFALNSRERLNLRVDAGFGQQSQGTYINVGEAF